MRDRTGEEIRGGGTAADAMGPGLDEGHAPTTPRAAMRHMVAGATNSSAEARQLAAAVAALIAAPVTGELGTAAVLADDLVVLAKATQVLAVETARRAHAAHAGEVTATGVRSTLARAGWTASAASRALRIGSFADRYPQVGAALRSGCLTNEGVLFLAHATRRLTPGERDRVITWAMSWASRLDAAGLKVAVTAAVERLRPDSAEQREQDIHDDRYLAFTRFRGMVLFEGRLPSLEGEAFAAAVAAYAERLRTQGDGLSAGQRAADGLTGMVAELVESQRVPSRNGAPANVSVIIPLDEADRVATGQARQDGLLPDLSGVVNGRSAADLSGSGVIAGSDTLGDAAARFLLCCADLAGVLVDTPSPVGGILGAAKLEPLALGRTRRLATATQRRALGVRDRGCVVPGCQVPADACQVHHVTDWSQGGVTDVDSLALLCWVHHRQVDLRRWSVTRSPDPCGPYWRVTRTHRSAWHRRT